MSGYLDNFGASDQRRETILKRIVLVAVIAAVIGGILYFQFRNYREEARLEEFMTLLEQKDFEPAYRLWGCTAETPCPGYPFEKFLQDWGPDSLHPDITAAEITRTRTCSDGIIKTLTFGEDDELWIWVASDDLVIGFAPWPVCNPRIPTSTLQGQ